MSTEMTLSVSRNVKRIKVNEAGEYIEVNLDDQAVIPRLVALMNEFEEAADEYTRKAAEIGELPEETPQESKAKISAAANLNLEVCTMLKQKVDEAFHDRVCNKIFGDVIPSVAAFAEFFAQFGELLSKFSKEIADERKKRIGKYTDKYTKRK